MSTTSSSTNGAAASIGTNAEKVEHPMITTVRNVGMDKRYDSAFEKTYELRGKLLPNSARVIHITSGERIGKFGDKLPLIKPILVGIASLEPAGEPAFTVQVVLDEAIAGAGYAPIFVEQLAKRNLIVKCKKAVRVAGDGETSPTDTKRFGIDSNGAPVKKTDGTYYEVGKDISFIKVGKVEAYFDCDVNATLKEIAAAKREFDAMHNSDTSSIAVGSIANA